MSSLTLEAPARSIDDQAHKYPRQDTCDWERDDPTTVDPSDHTPIDCPPITRAQADTDGSTGNTLSSGDG